MTDDTPTHPTFDKVSSGLKARCGSPGLGFPQHLKSIHRHNEPETSEQWGEAVRAPHLAGWLPVFCPQAAEGSSEFSPMAGVPVLHLRVSVLWSVLVFAVSFMLTVGTSSLPALLPDDFKCRILVFERAVEPLSVW